MVVEKVLKHVGPHGKAHNVLGKFGVSEKKHLDVVSKFVGGKKEKGEHLDLDD